MKTAIQNKVLFGKDSTERVVSVEVKRNSLVIFQEDSMGNVVQHERHYMPWILASGKTDFGFTELSGDLFYRYIKEYDDYELYQQDKKTTESSWYINDDTEAALLKTGITYYKEMAYSEVSVLSFDIEGLGLVDHDKHKVLTISNTFRKGGISGSRQKKLFSLDEYDSEKDMLLAWCEWVRLVNPSVIVGHNVYAYDFPYLNICAKKNGISLNLGRDESAISFKKGNIPDRFRVDQSQFFEFYPCHIFGREIVDTYFLAQKYDVERNYDNYKLKYLIEHEGLIKGDRTFYDAKSIGKNWDIIEEREKIKKYCEDDGDDALALYDLMIPSFFYLANSIPKTFSDIINKASGSQINGLMTRAYLQDGHSIPRASQSNELVGGISLGNVGVYSNVLKVDVKSMYPSIIRHYKVYDEKKDPNMYFLQIVDYFTEERFKNKNLYKINKERRYSDLEKAQKIIINSAYGFLATKGLLFNSPEKASFVTEKGREILNEAMYWANKNNFNIVNADTDSISFCRKDNSPIIDTEQRLIIKDLNSNYPDMIEWENDGYFKAIIVVKAKNYAYLIDDKIIIKGSGLKATGKEPALREMIDRVVKSLLSVSDEKVDIIYNELIKEILNVKDIHRWAKRAKISEAIMTSDRTNEVKIREALTGIKYQKGDIFFMYYNKEENLKLVDNFDSDYNEDTLLEKVFKTISIFDDLIDKKICINYKLKKNKELLNNFL